MVVEGGRAKVVDAHEKTANPDASTADADGATP
jgi:hypothetical protein